jgi:glycosyltransferase involved in cell wall biosynthesis
VTPAPITATVACVVPVHNGERYLAQTLRSILAQTLRPAEVVVVDDGSSDDSAAIAQSFGDPVRVIRQEHRGPASARNRGVAEAHSELVAFLDADDLFHPRKLERQAARFAARPELDVSVCTAENFWEPGLEAEQARYEALGRTRFAHAFQTTVARRSVFERIGMLAETWLHGDYMEWVTRVSDAGLVIEVLPDVLVSRRMHRNSLSHRDTDAKPYLDIIRKRLVARRAQAADT